MAAPLTADQLLAAFRAEGVTVVEGPGWRTWNRNAKGPWGPVHGVLLHHSVTRGTARTVEMCHDGYEGLPGPLCHGVIAKSGTLYTIGYGRTNHAGLGDPDVLAAVIEERPAPVDDQATVDGNRCLYGFESENLGDGLDPWPAEQLLTMEKVAAAICRAHGWDARSVIGHLEWQPGKVDPRGFPMEWMRDQVAARLDHGAPGAVPPAVRPKVSLRLLVAAARNNPSRAGHPISYSGVVTVEAALVDEGVLAKTYQDGHYGTETITAMSWWQERCGFHGRAPGQPADGIPGLASLTRLGLKHGFDVTT